MDINASRLATDWDSPTLLLIVCPVLIMMEGGRAPHLLPAALRGRGGVVALAADARQERRLRAELGLLPALLHHHHLLLALDGWCECSLSNGYRRARTAHVRSKRRSSQAVAFIRVRPGHTMSKTIGQSQPVASLAASISIP